MSILQGDISDARVLDLFAGTGALGLEALSRGAASADFVENDSDSLRRLKENIELLGAHESARVHRANAITFAQGLDENAYDLAFADPPYETESAVLLARRWLDSPFSSVLGVEHSTRSDMPDGGDTRRYGTTAITFYRR